MIFTLRRPLAGLLLTLTGAAATAADERPLFTGQPAPGLRLTVVDMEGEVPFAGDAVVVPKPPKPQVPTSEVRAERRGQAIRLQWKEAWYAALRFEANPPWDLSTDLADGTLEFDVRSDDLAHAGLNIAMSCGPDCGRKVNHVMASRALAGKGWQRLAFSLQCFVREGADFRRVERPFVLETSGTGSVEIANARIVRRGKPNASCPDHRSQSVTPTPLEEIWSIDWWMPRHEAKRAEVRQRQQAGERVELVFIGDSITQGWENEGQAIWRQHYAPLKALNLGFGGDRTENALWRLQHGELDGIRPKAAVLMIGTNNTGDRREDPRTTAAGIRRLVDEIRQRLPQTPVLLLAVFPRDEQPTSPLRRLNDQLNQLIAGFADGRQVVYLDISRALMNPDGTLSREVMPDLLHLSERGYAAWAEAMAPALAPWLTPP